ncbi:EAL domain-containing protein [Paenibacillus rhizovicinus]|uniref:EAL domain-containing protein n=1 Tax=Paenibacillus rhizovicinus TaxID=2704463 RepID=A0A6C0P610_9BACL|nr:EAL domain-containing protein [Paenibacillus rhizovicinus]QHW33937.1 EAL domain-containing protein [Paenibacillus rhizovicinus]
MNVSRNSDSMGIIYFAWHGKAQEKAEIKGRLRADWRRFAEKVLDEDNVSGLNGVSRLWMRDDLFVCFALPQERLDRQEERLLEIGNDLQLDWEPRFMNAAFGGHVPELRLHAGVSFLDGGIASEEERLYDGIKRAIVHGQSTDAAERSLKRRALDHILEERLIQPVYQPIMAIQPDMEALFGYEALSRLPGSRWFDGPLGLFNFANEEGLTYALDRLAREKAIEGCAGLANGRKLFINITAKIMNDPTFSPGQTLLLLQKYGLSPHHVVFEITERTSIEDFDAAKRILQHYRNQGYQIAIDDAGAGYSSLQSIVELQPDFIKIDRSLIRGIHLDRMKGHLVQTFADLAAKMDIKLIAEGIEEVEELKYIRALGVQYAQGFLLGRPAPYIV